MRIKIKDVKIDNETILFVAHRAALMFGTNKDGKQDGIFNSACFSAACAEVFCMRDLVLSGEVVELILGGRDRIKQLSGGAHWQI